MNTCKICSRSCVRGIFSPWRHTEPREKKTNVKVSAQVKAPESFCFWHTEGELRQRRSEVRWGEVQTQGNEQTRLHTWVRACCYLRSFNDLISAQLSRSLKGGRKTSWWEAGVPMGAGAGTRLPQILTGTVTPVNIGRKRAKEKDEGHVWQKVGKRKILVL